MKKIGLHTRKVSDNNTFKSSVSVLGFPLILILKIKAPDCY